MQEYYYFQDKTLPTPHNLANVFDACGIYKSSSKEKAFFKDDNLDEDICLKHLEDKGYLSKLLKNKSYYPKTYEINQLSQLEKLEKNDGQKTAYWIVKPRHQNNGHAIYVGETRTLKDDFNQNLASTLIYQRYIDNPLLIDGFKQSLRYLLVIDKQKGAYLYQKAYQNLANKPYDLIKPFDREKHLTNEHISELYQGKQSILQKNSLSENWFYQVKDIINDLLMTFANNYGYFSKQVNEQKLSFWGVDFMVDANNKLWLLELNHGPCFPKSQLHPLYFSFYQPFWQSVVSDIILANQSSISATPFVVIPVILRNALF